MWLRLGVCFALITLGSASGGPVHAEPSPRLAAQQAQAGTRQARLGTRPMVLGYYVPYDGSAWDSLERNVGRLDMVAAQWVTIDGCGNVGSRDDQTLKEFAREHGVRVLPSLLVSSGRLNHQLLTDDETAAHAVEQIVGYTLAEDYVGFDLDLEGVDAADRTALTRFVTWLSGALHTSGKLLTLAVPAKQRDTTVDWLGAYDYAALGAEADLVTVMAYEVHGAFSGPGSIAPYDWVARVAGFATSQIDPQKVLLGLAMYGYDWNLTSGGTRGLGYPKAMALAEHYGADLSFTDDERSLTFDYSAPAGEDVPIPTPHELPTHTFTLREPPPCDVAPPTAASPSSRPEPTDGALQAHEVWLEDGQSIAARLRIADRSGAGGIATWRLGLEDPQVWPLVDAWRAP